MCNRHFLKLSLILVIVLMSKGIFAGVPTIINYQGRLTDTDGIPVDTAVSMTFSIYDDSLGTNDVWTEFHKTVNVSSGLFNIILGSINPISGVFSSPDRYLGIKVGSDQEITPLTRITSVAYSHKSFSADTSGFSAFSDQANFALNSDMVDGIEAVDLEESEEIVNAVASYSDSLFMSQFQNLFIYDHHFPNIGTYSLFTAPPEKSIYITGIYCTGLYGNWSAIFSIDGTGGIRISGSADVTNSWICCGGAPIQVLPGHQVSVNNVSTQLYITITGYEL